MKKRMKRSDRVIFATWISFCAGMFYGMMPYTMTFGSILWMATVGALLMFSSLLAVDKLTSE